ncbi:hypothetical protein CMI37_37670 [Candidatus Pacearchaeota archaeon]|nr:hypothetical protein [Candidatus Pacearchaeota archaeon]
MTDTQLEGLLDTYVEESDVETNQESKNSWETEEEWVEHGIENGYNGRSPSSFYKSENKKERSWFGRGKRTGWASNFKFTRKNQACKWKTKEEWAKHGLENGFNERNPSSLLNSDDKKEKQWYSRGNTMRWLKEFEFERNWQLTPWQNFDDWQQYGIENGYDERNSYSILDSENEVEQSWYRRGNRMKWLKDFEFSQSVLWKTEEEWNQYGLEQKFNETNPDTLSKGEDKLKKRWYKRGVYKEWLKDFDFRKKNEDTPWQNFEEWEHHGREQGYEERSPISLIKSEDSNEKSWYQRGAYKKWTKDFPFTKIVGKWQELDYTLGYALQIINENELENLPTAQVLKELNQQILTYAICKYHGGFPVFRDQLRKYMGNTIETDSDKLESLLDKYTGDNEK